MESMKMEIPVMAPVKGRLRELLVKEGQEVSEGQDLAVIET
jgi:biotin carboxyl carrier protein